MFGVHKGWQEQADGSWLRTLRLIGPDRPPEDEVILCYAEDVRHCFHIFSPSPKWRGYFVIGKVAASSCFNYRSLAQLVTKQCEGVGALFISYFFSYFWKSWFL